MLWARMTALFRNRRHWEWWLGMQSYCHQYEREYNALYAKALVQSHVRIAMMERTKPMGNKLSAKLAEAKDG
jgi:hypothetical protein